MRRRRVTELGFLAYIFGSLGVRPEGNEGVGFSAVSVISDCDIGSNPIVLVSRVMIDRPPGESCRPRTQNCGSSPLPFIDDPCQLRAIAKVVMRDFDVNASFTRELDAHRTRE
jgi:hypothetical protein